MMNHPARLTSVSSDDAFSLKESSTKRIIRSAASPVFAQGAAEIALSERPLSLLGARDRSAEFGPGDERFASRTTEKVHPVCPNWRNESDGCEFEKGGDATMKFYFSIIGLCSLLASLPLFAGPAQADVAGFYKGKTVKVLIGSRAGGSYDAYGRMMTRFMGRHIPGNPTLVAQNMPGAAGTRVASFLYNVAPKDGTVLGATLNTIVFTQLTKKVKYDSGRFNWLGIVNSPISVLTTWHTSGVKTLADAREKSITIGATTAGSAQEQFPVLANNLLGTKFKVVLGYRGGAGVNLAMERGEVGGRGGNTWLSWKKFHPDWVRERKINIIFQIGLNKHPDLPDVPLMMDLAANEKDRRVLKLVSQSIAIGRSMMAPPDLPSERVEALRQAFSDTVGDEAFLKDARKRKLAVDPVPGVKLQGLVKEMLDTPQEIVDHAIASLKGKSALSCEEQSKSSKNKVCRKKK